MRKSALQISHTNSINSPFMKRSFIGMATLTQSKKKAGKNAHINRMDSEKIQKIQKKERISGKKSQTSRVSRSMRESDRGRNKSVTQTNAKVRKSLTLEKKAKKVQVIPDSIKFKQRNQWHRNAEYENKENKENKENMSYPSNKQIINNSGLLNIQKPTKTNFVNKTSKIYELVIAQVKLPQFIEYFLGEALFLIQKKSRNNSIGYDWKLDDFKHVCEKIYENSEEEDLKYFMSMRLPELNRWGAGGKGLGEGLAITSGMMTRLNTFSSKLGTVNEPLFGMEKYITTNSNLSKSNDSRFAFMNENEESRVCTRDRLNYFKSLSRKQSKPVNLKVDFECEVLERVENKLNSYFQKTHGCLDITSHVI